MERPNPPEVRLSCGTCGYTAPKSEFNHDVWHKNETFMFCVLLAAVIITGIFL